MHPDQKYIDALLRNDATLLDELYEKCYPGVRSMVLYNKGSEDKAADLFQEALIDLFRKVKTQEFTLTSSICAYIKGICTFKWRDELKKRKQEGVTFTDFEGQDEIGENTFLLNEEHLLKQGRLDLIRKKLKDLGESCRELISLGWSPDASGKKRSTEEIAALLQITNAYARKKKSECIARLIKLVMEDPEFERLKQ